MHWYVGTLLGSIALVALNTAQRLYGPREWTSYLFVIPLLLVCNQGFWWGFHHAPNFIQVWFLGTGTVATLGWLSHVFILHEPVNEYHIAGFVMIFVGSILLALGGK